MGRWVQLREKLFFIGQRGLQWGFKAEGRNGPLPLVVDWRAFGGRVVVVYVFHLRRQQIVGRGRNAERTWDVVVANLDLRFIREFVDTGFDGSGRWIVADGLTCEHCFADVSGLDFVKISNILERWKDVSRWDRYIGCHCRSLEGKTVFK